MKTKINEHVVPWDKSLLKTQHTPTPWRVELYEHEDTSENLIQSEGALCIASVDNSDEVDRANAAFIVRAVNAHEELVAACKDYLEDLRNHGGTWTIERLKQAIAKAEGNNMELYKDAVTNELRNMLTAWEMATNNPAATLETITRLRLKINGLCMILDKIERMEQEAA